MPQLAAEILRFIGKFKMVAVAISDFVFVKYHGVHTKCRAIACNNDRVMREKQNVKWQPPLSWILLFVKLMYRTPSVSTFVNGGIQV